MPSEDGSRAFYIVKYSESELNELERVIAYSQLDVKKCSRANLTRAVMRSFAESDRQTLRGTNQALLGRVSLTLLERIITSRVQRLLSLKPIRTYRNQKLSHGRRMLNKH